MQPVPSVGDRPWPPHRRLMIATATETTTTGDEHPPRDP